jgi:NAD(P)H-dependent nitrite reductase small subunit
MTLLDDRTHAAAPDPATPAAGWVAVCPLDHLIPERGVAALVGDRAVAVFRLGDEVRAIDNVDPYTGASVLSRGLVGTAARDGASVRYVASPLRKQRFDLDTGRDLDGDRHRAPFPTRVVGGIVHVAASPGEGSQPGNHPETSA